jgi:membrane dipeptidase
MGPAAPPNLANRIGSAFSKVSFHGAVDTKPNDGLPESLSLLHLLHLLGLCRIGQGARRGKQGGIIRRATVGRAWLWWCGYDRYRVAMNALAAARCFSILLASWFPILAPGPDDAAGAAVKIGLEERMLTAEALDLHRRAIVVDTHADTTQRIVYQGGRFVEGIAGAHLDFPKMRAGGLDAQFLAIFASPRRTSPRAFFSESLRQVQIIQDLVAASGGRLAFARTAREIRANVARGTASVLLGLEGGHSLGPGDPSQQLEHLRRLAADGVRYLTLTWTNSNDIGGSSGDGGDGLGLTNFGRRVLDEMQKLGVLVDLSHASDPLFWDAIRYVRKPVMLSHSSSRAVTNVPRNVSDAMLRAVAKNGGAVCVNFNPGFLDIDFNRAQAPLWARWKDLPVDERWRRVQEDSLRLRPVSMSRVADHIMHMIEIAGADHVCLGSDFDGIPTTPIGLEDASRLPALTLELRRRGVSPADIEKVLGANTLRVIEANEVR